MDFPPQATTSERQRTGRRQFERKTIRGSFDRTDAAAKLQSRTMALHFCQQHFNYLQCRTVAEELSERLLVIGDAMPLDQCNEIALCVAAQGRDTEVRILREIILRACMQVGEIAAPATRYTDFLSGCLGVVHDQYGTPALRGFDGAHHACRASAYDHNIDCFQLTLLRMAPVHSTAEAYETESFAIADNHREIN
jgi:hypothetical protein